MEKVHTSTELKAAIRELEQRQELEGKMLKGQFYDAYESIKPINMVKNTLREALAPGELKDNLINISVSLVAGYLSRALFSGVGNSSLRKVLSGALTLGITRTIAQNPQALNTLGRTIGKLASSKKPTPELKEVEYQEPVGVPALHA